MCHVYKYIGSCLLVLLFACEDALRIDPETMVTFGTAFKNEKEIETGLLSVERYVRIASVNNVVIPGAFGEYSDYHANEDPSLLNFSFTV